MVDAMIVQIPITTANFAGAMSKMRSWLDHNHCDRVRFYTHSGEPGTVLITIEFADDADAKAFKLTFDPEPPKVSDVAA